MLRLKVATEMDLALGGKASPMWNPDNPWEAMFRKLMKDSDFLAEQAHVPANAWPPTDRKESCSPRLKPLQSQACGAAVLKPETEGPKTAVEPPQ